MEAALLTVLQEKPKSYLRTSTLLQHISASAQGKQRTKLRKRILYHLRKLERQKKVVSKRTDSNGEKAFRLCQKRTRTQVFEKGFTSKPGIRQRSKQGQLRFTKSDTQDSVCIEGTKPLQHIEKKIDSANVEDCVIMRNADGHSDSKQFFNIVNTYAKEKDIYACYILKLEEIHLPTIQHHFKTAPHNSNIVFTWQPTQRMDEELTQIATLCKEYKQKLYLLNRNMIEPFGIGRYGPYNALTNTFQTVHIDVERFLKENTLTQLRTVCKDAYGNIVQRARSQGQTEDRLMAVRLWNYARSSEAIAFPLFQNLMESIHKEVEQIRVQVESTHRKTGITPTFNPFIAPAIGSHMPKEFTVRSYSKTVCNGFAHIRTPVWQDILQYREKTARLFKGVDRCRIFRSKEYLEDVPKELHYIHTRYAIPLLCYDFRSLRKETPLTEFI